MQLLFKLGKGRIERDNENEQETKISKIPGSGPTCCIRFISLQARR